MKQLAILACLLAVGRTALGRSQRRLLVLTAPAGNVWAVVTDDDGYVAGDNQGFYRGTVNGSWLRYSLSSGDLGDDWVMSIVSFPEVIRAENSTNHACRSCVVSEHSAWVGMYKGGVVRFDWQSNKPDVLTSIPFGDGWVNPGG